MCIKTDTLINNWFFFVNVIMFAPCHRTFFYYRVYKNSWVFISYLCSNINKMYCLCLLFIFGETLKNCVCTFFNEVFEWNRTDVIRSLPSAYSKNVVIKISCCTGKYVCKIQLYPQNKSILNKRHFIHVM